MTDKSHAPDHSAIRKLDPFSFEVSHRRLAWITRLSVMLNFGLISVIVVMAAVILEFLPLKETRFVFLREEVDTNRVIRVEPVSKNVDGYDILLESKAREFVELILPIDELTEAERYKKAFKMTTGTFYETFKRDRLDSGFLAEAKQDRLNRSIVVESVDVRKNPANVNTHLVSVDVVQSDRFGNAEDTRKKRLRVYLEMTALPQQVHEEELYTNPLGIVIMNMTIKERT